MPTIPQQQTIVQYVANSSQTQYTFAFYAFNQANINVYYQASNATPVPAADILTLGSQYTVTFNSDPTTGGYITLLFTPTSGFYLTIALNLIPTLNTNFANAQNFNGANLDAALDYLLMLCQQNLNYALQRNLSYVINTYLPNAVPYTQLPPLPQNYIWVGSGSGVIAAQIATVPSASILQSMLANNSPNTDGSRLVGYYNATTSTPTTVQAFLASLNTAFGQIVSSVIPSASAITFASAAKINVTSISLPAGTWMVWGNVTLFDSAGDMANAAIWSSQISLDSPDSSLLTAFGSNSGLFYSWTGNIPTLIYTLSGTSTIYLTTDATSVGAHSMTACGGLYALRIQ